MTRPTLLAAAAVALSPLALPQTPTWTQLTPAVSPSPRWKHAMSFDAARDRVVLYGGHELGGFPGDTWEFDGANWTQIATPVRPTPDYAQTMVYDRARAVSVLFGGFPGGNETWLWDGSAWSQALPQNSPSPRLYSAMAYDSDRDVVVLFGGNPLYSTAYLDETWEWNGTDWAPVSAPNAPPARLTQMTYDASRRRVVMFGGEGSVNFNIVAYNDTWEFDGSDWQQVSTPTSPSPRGVNVLVYDFARKRVVMHGGLGPAPTWARLNDTWEYEGSTWTQIAPGNSPAHRRGLDHAVLDSVRGRLVMFGGYGSGGRLNDTWEYEGRTTGLFSIYGAPCNTAASAPSLAGTTPTIGQPLDLTFGNLGSSFGVIVALGFSDETWAGQSLPYNLGAVGLPNCELRTSADFVVWAAATAGTATYSSNLPTDPALINLAFFCQGLVIDLNPTLVFTGATALGRVVVGS